MRRAGAQVQDNWLRADGQEQPGTGEYFVPHVLGGAGHGGAGAMGGTGGIVQLMPCPPNPPGPSAGCNTVGVVCYYEDCAGAGRTVATCQQQTSARANWSLQVAACGATQCIGLPSPMSCTSGQICSVFESGVIAGGNCAQSSCGKGPVTCECAHASCTDCEIRQRHAGLHTVTCNNCPSAGARDVAVLDGSNSCGPPATTQLRNAWAVTIGDGLRFVQRRCSGYQRVPAAQQEAAMQRVPVARVATMRLVVALQRNNQQRAA